MHPYYVPSVYTPSAIEIADPSFSAQSLLNSGPTLTIHHADSFSDSTYKKRKIDRACDACRRRKTKCDGPRMPENVCTNCIQNRKICTYIEASKPRGPPKAYITSLEDRVEKMETLLKRFRARNFFCGPAVIYCFIYFCDYRPRSPERKLTITFTQLRPEADFSEELGPPVIRDSWRTDTDPPPYTSHDKSAPHSTSTTRLKKSPSRSLRFGALTASNPSLHIVSRGYRSGDTPKSDTESSSSGYSSSDSGEVGELSLSRGIKRLTLRGLEPTQDPPLPDNQVRFHGKSSFFKLIEPTRKLRDEHVNSLTSGEERSPSSRDSASPINAAALRRPEFWATPQWELAFEGSLDRFKILSLSLTKDFPPQDLADSLIKIYFEHVNIFIPLFHRPTFEQQWRQGLQHRDTWFGCLCLSLFAISSRWSDDPRVLDSGDLAEEPVKKHEWQRAGWRFFNAAVDIHRASLSLFHPAGLFEVQTMALLGMFLRSTAFHPVAWLFFSIGLRKAQDVGAHRKKIYGDKPSVEGELWKRAFWVLVLHDRIASAALGRPCCSGEEEFDAELPLEVDDEYWVRDDSEKAFQQPLGQPSKIAAFNSHLKLTKIVAYAMRTIYALDRSKLMFSIARPRWPVVLAKLNHAMTEWVDSIPKHLHWSPHIDNLLFSNQSATLYITYYLIQIIIYRPFLPPSLHSVTNVVPHCNMPIPCIAICVNAAKRVSRILKAQISRGYSDVLGLILCSHVCAAVLLMNFWDLKWQDSQRSGEDVKSPLASAMAELLEEISVFVDALEAVQHRWRVAEMYLNDLRSSFPHNLGGFEPNHPKNDPVLSHSPPRFDDRAFPGTIPQDHVISGESRNSNQAAATSIVTYRHGAQTKLTERSPHFFDFPHVTRYPVPGTLPFSSFAPSPPRDQSIASQSTVPQWGYDRRLRHTEFNDQGSSITSSNHSRPASILSEGNTDEIRHDFTFCQQHLMADRASWGDPIPISTHHGEVGTFGHSPPRPSWASDFDYNPTYPYGSSSGNASNH